MPESDAIFPVNNPFRHLDGYNCFGCSPGNAIGLKMQFNVEGDMVTCHWMPKPEYQGWFNILHGGIQVTLMDEIASWFVLVMLKTAGVTSGMEVRLVKPVQIDKGELRLEARLKEQKRNIAYIGVSIFQNRVLVAESVMHYFTFPEQYAREKMYYPGSEYFKPEE